jgi:RNA polymerase sigma factor (sigma-70 family)
MVARLARHFGPRRLDLAEEAVQDALCRALETWMFHGIPENPEAWLMRTAHNRMIDLLRRDRRLGSAVSRLANEPQESLGEGTAGAAAHDDRLSLMLSCCHPKLAVEAQIALILKALCGFSLGEIAAAFFSSEAAVEKRVTRAKSFLRQSKSLFDLDNPVQVGRRIGAVHQALYLLFSEGYHSLRADAPVRDELCHEAIRLAQLIDADPAIRTVETSALLALMFFDLARLSGRTDEGGLLLPLAEQDRSHWDQKLIALGYRHLAASAIGDSAGPRHLEAAIASEHCRAPSLAGTDWQLIVELYDQLAMLAPSPIVALNRAIALGFQLGFVAGLAALQEIAAEPTLRAYPFLHAALGEFHARAGEPDEAKVALRLAVANARSPAEQAFFAKKLAVLRPEPSIQAAGGAPT